jgi:hypothetical protein
MLWLGIILCGISAICSLIALSGSPRFEKKTGDLLLVLLPSVAIFPIIPFFLLKRVRHEWPRLSVYSLSILVSIAAAIAGALILLPIITQ